MNRYYSRTNKKNILIALIVLLTLLLLTLSSVLFTQKQLVVKIDGAEYNVETNKIIIDNVMFDIYDEFDLEQSEVKVDYTDHVIVNSDIEIDILTKKNITVNVNNNEIELSTYTNDVDTFMDELYNNSEVKENIDTNAEYFIKDEITEINDGINVTLVKLETKEITEQQNMGRDTIEVANDSMYEGVKKVKSSGQDQIDEVTYEVVYHDGVEVEKTEIARNTVVDQVAKEVYVGTKEISPDDMAVWDALSYCEAGGNWATNTGNGYYGGLQINPGAWKRIAPTLGITASLPSEATKEEQIAVGKVMQASGGWGQWPHCSSTLGL